jgi:Leucine-rich repeat (LRR) protein
MISLNSNIILSPHNDMTYFYENCEKFHCNFNDVTMKNISVYTNLTILNLNKLNLVCLPENISELHNLRLLCCDYNNIENINIKFKNLNVFTCFDNKLTKFPNIEAPLSCLHIGRNNITDIPYKKIIHMELIVFLYFDNPFDDFQNNKKLRMLESQRQQTVIENEFPFIFTNIEKVRVLHNNKKISISLLKSVEEANFEEYYMNEFIDEILHNNKKN